jgi:hypothetical protein
LAHVVANNGASQKALGLKRPLFAAAIANSAFDQVSARFNSSGPIAAYQNLVIAGGCDGTNDTLACLADLDEETFAAASAGVAESA